MESFFENINAFKVGPAATEKFKERERERILVAIS